MSDKEGDGKTTLKWILWKFVVMMGGGGDYLRILSNGVLAVLNFRVLRVRWKVIQTSRNMPEAGFKTAVR